MWTGPFALVQRSFAAHLINRGNTFASRCTCQLHTLGTAVSLTLTIGPSAVNILQDVGKGGEAHGPPTDLAVKMSIPKTEAAWMIQFWIHEAFCGVEQKLRSHGLLWRTLRVDLSFFHPNFTQACFHWLSARFSFGISTRASIVRYGHSLNHFNTEIIRIRL